MMLMYECVVWLYVYCGNGFSLVFGFGKSKYWRFLKTGTLLNLKTKWYWLTHHQQHGRDIMIVYLTGKYMEVWIFFFLGWHQKKKKLVTEGKQIGNEFAAL